MTSMVMALCEGRHEIPQAKDGAIFPSVLNPTDLTAMSQMVHKALSNCSRLDLYVTGLTVALVEVINYCCFNLIPLTLWHYDRDTGNYYPQRVPTDHNADLLYEAGYISRRVEA